MNLHFCTYACRVFLDLAPDAWPLTTPCPPVPTSKNPHITQHLTKDTFLLGEDKFTSHLDERKRWRKTDMFLCRNKKLWFPAGRAPSERVEKNPSKYNSQLHLVASTNSPSFPMALSSKSTEPRCGPPKRANKTPCESRGVGRRASPQRGHSCRIHNTLWIQLYYCGLRNPAPPGMVERL